MNLERIGEDSLDLIKKATWFPFHRGHLKNDATSGEMINSKTYMIKFDGDIAPYVEALEEGSRPHDILGAFIGKEKAIKMNPPFGVGGRFDGKFHPGSMKHIGFIKDKSVRAIIRNICDKYNGELK